ncbi:MAG: DUF3261 domain-containing protein [Planctomycetota bacterium]
MRRTTVRSTAAAAASVLAAALLAGSCASAPAAHSQGPLAARDYPGELQLPEQLTTQAVWQQRVTASWQAPGQPRQTRGFDAAVQRQGATLTVLGLSPVGSVGFAIRQTGKDVQVDNHMQEELRIPPRFILLDVQRAFFPWFDNSAKDAVDASGYRQQIRGGERVRERLEQGRVVQRTFERVDNAPAGTIRIDYEWGEPDWAVPTRVVLDNGWFGYELVVETHDETRLAQTLPKARPKGAADGLAKHAMETR